MSIFGEMFMPVRNKAFNRTEALRRIFNGERIFHLDYGCLWWDDASGYINIQQLPSGVVSPYNEFLSKLPLDSYLDRWPTPDDDRIKKYADAIKNATPSMSSGYATSYIASEDSFIRAAENCLRLANEEIAQKLAERDKAPIDPQPDTEISNAVSPASTDGIKFDPEI